MLYNLNWLQPGKSFPPKSEENRIRRYKQNKALFEGEHFAETNINSTRVYDNVYETVQLYRDCARRISRVIANFEEHISFPVLLNYQRLMTLKMADLVCGEYPSISGANAFENAVIEDVRDFSDLDAKLYSTVIDLSRYGDAVYRLYLDPEADKRTNYSLWDPAEWFPVVSQDGTFKITHHCICWRENLTPDGAIDTWVLHVQIHGTSKADIGHYEHRVYALDGYCGTIGTLKSSEVVQTGLECCAIKHIRSYVVSGTVYGFDDYVTLDSLLGEIMARVGQISVILDKHADPSMTGPVSMLEIDPKTGERFIKMGKFFGVAPGDEQPKYLTWDGQLSAAFKELEALINQLYILSEMGAALLGSTDGSGQAISGTAMRFKMVNPLAKARRVSNSLTRPMKEIIHVLSADAEKPELPKEVPEGEEPPSTELPIPYKNISIEWSDGLPDDPRESIENAKLATGETKMMPLEVAIRRFFKRSQHEAADWVKQISEASKAKAAASGLPTDKDPNHPGPQDGTGVNPTKKGSATGVNNFHSDTNGDVSE